MKIFIEKDAKTINYKVNGKKIVSDVLKELKISTSSVIIVKNNAICLENSIVTDADDIKLLSVVSGG